MDYLCYGFLLYFCKSETISILVFEKFSKIFAFVHGMLSAVLGLVSVKIWLNSLAISSLLVYVLLFSLKHVGNCVLNLCLDII